MDSNYNQIHKKSFNILTFKHFFHFSLSYKDKESFLQVKKSQIYVNATWVRLASRVLFKKVSNFGIKSFYDNSLEKSFNSKKKAQINLNIPLENETSFCSHFLQNKFFWSLLKKYLAILSFFLLQSDWMLSKKFCRNFFIFGKLICFFIPLNKMEGFVNINQLSECDA